MITPHITPNRFSLKSVLNSCMYEPVIWLLVELPYWQPQVVLSHYCHHVTLLNDIYIILQIQYTCIYHIIIMVCCINLLCHIILLEVATFNHCQLFQWYMPTAKAIWLMQCAHALLYLSHTCDTARFVKLVPSLHLTKFSKLPLLSAKSTQTAIPCMLCGRHFSWSSLLCRIIYRPIVYT